MDNIFILVHTHQRDGRRKDETHAEHVGRTLGRVGPSMLLTSVSEASCFLIGSYRTYSSLGPFPTSVFVTLLSYRVANPRFLCPLQFCKGSVNRIFLRVLLQGSYAYFWAEPLLSSGRKSLTLNVTTDDLSVLAMQRTTFWHLCSKVANNPPYCQEILPFFYLI